MAEDVKKTVFVICPIGKEGGTTRIQSDKLLKYVIRDVLEPIGYLVERADQLSEPGIITNQIVQKIVDCDILIADLSEGNPNVFYELAIRHGLKRPFIHMINASEKVPFDNAQVRTIPFDLTDLDSVSKAKVELAAQVSAIESSERNAESPISVAFDLEKLRASGSTDQNVLATLFDEIAALRAEFRAARRNSGGMRTIDGPSNETEFLDLIYKHGSPDLIRMFNAAKLQTFESGRVSLTTNLSFEQDEELESALRELLKRYSRRAWEVDVVPF